MPVSLGLGLPQMKQYDIGRDVATVARAAEDAGYESLWVFERVLFPGKPPRGCTAYRGCRGPMSTAASPTRWSPSHWPPRPPAGPGSAPAS